MVAYGDTEGSLRVYVCVCVCVSRGIHLHESQTEH